MKRLRPFSYSEPTSLEAAVWTLAESGGEAYPFAGGTDLLVRMKRGELRPSALVNLKGIPGLDGIFPEEGGNLRLGALVTIARLAGSPWILSRGKALAQAAGLLGSPPVRNLGTIGGNIGRASPASDLAPALLVLGARAAVEGPGGKREMEVESLFRGPGQTTLAAGELITSFSLPDPGPHTASVYLKLGRREGVDCALVGAGVLVSLEGKTRRVKAARIALSSVAPVPLRARQAEELLLSGPLTEERMKEAGRMAAEGTFPISDLRCSGTYRREMSRVLVFRALAEARQVLEGGREI